jgi:hypothetical protein
MAKYKITLRVSPSDTQHPDTDDFDLVVMADVTADKEPYQTNGKRLGRILGECPLVAIKECQRID